MVMLICKAKADPVKKKAAARTEEESEHESSSTEMNIKHDKANPNLHFLSPNQLASASYMNMADKKHLEGSLTKERLKNLAHTPLELPKEKRWQETPQMIRGHPVNGH
ncbi:hypothetical protein OIU74_002505 [Salix koriyanagi]|uniref:Uncharacterized protein n=1 Tax=Salix koriyanagi TaxID=2511006 RepID=A0A9Q1APB3_9ROSI|nr:hypothetical protein OIU74_002505 [Salix koriyanagi]